MTNSTSSFFFQRPLGLGAAVDVGSEATLPGARGRPGSTADGKGSATELVVMGTGGALSAADGVSVGGGMAGPGGCCCK